jgi:hypothetical protein
MPYPDLYAAVQANGADRISTNWLRARAIEFSAITGVREQWSGAVDPVYLRGFYIEGPMGPPVAVEAGAALIVLSRAMCLGAQGEYMRRFILTKELMHVFDTEEEKANSKEKFDRQIQRLKDPNAADNPQHRAELKAYWRALGVLCTETKRLEYKGLLQRDEISWDVVAASLRIPVGQVRLMMDANFEAYLQHSM